MKPSVARQTPTEPILPTVEPATVEEIRSLVREAEACSVPILPSGSGNHLHLGNASTGRNTVLSVRKLDETFEYYPENFTVGVQAGVSTTSLLELLAKNGQELPFDLSGRRPFTIGGLVATGYGGPRRSGRGTIRDYVIGIEAVRGGGESVRSGGRVVKNVAGYDLAKLYIGSHGTLGIITRVYLKLRPQPEVRRGRYITFDDAASAWNLVATLREKHLDPPSLMVLNREASSMMGGPKVTPAGAAVWALNEGWAEEVTASEEEANKLSSPGAWDVDAHADRTLEALSDLALPDPQEVEQGLVLRCAVLPGRTPEAFESLARKLPGATLWADANCGFILARIDAAVAEDPESELAKAVDLLATLAGEVAGQARILAAPEWLRQERDLWLAPPAAPDWLRRVKSALDPRGIFAPGREPGRMSRG